MYTMLPWFTALIDVVDMAISKCEPTIAANYDAQLVKNLDHPDVHKLVALGDRLRKEFALTKKHLLELRGYNVPQEENDILLRGLRVRNPYVDPLNVLQAEVLRRLRTGEYVSSDERAELEDALIVTINGIANGQKNTG